MITTEFEYEVRKMGFYVGYSPLYLFVVDNHAEKLACISKKFDMRVNTEYPEFTKLPQEQRAALFDLVCEIAKTPLAEREEEKRYRLRLVTSLPMLEGWRYLNQDTELMGEEYFIHNEIFSPGSRSIFTETEISQMDITGFEKVEVSE